MSSRIRPRILLVSCLLVYMLRTKGPSLNPPSYSAVFGKSAGPKARMVIPEVINASMKQPVGDPSSLSIGQLERQQERGCDTRSFD